MADIAGCARPHLNLHMNLNVLVLPGDGIGTEVTREAVRVLKHVAREVESPAHDSPKACSAASRFIRPARRFPTKPRELALAADATLMGAVGLAGVR